MRSVRALLLVAAPLLLGACDSLGRLTSDAPPRIIEVQSANAADVSVYLRRGNYEYPIGVVPANSKATLLVPARLVPANGTVQLIGDPKGAGRAFAMNPFRLEADQYVKW